MADSTLSKKIDGKFKMSAKRHVGIYHFAGRDINTATCTEAEAQYMVDNGAKFIEKITGEDKKNARAFFVYLCRLYAYPLSTIIKCKEGRIP
jgi:hypothetical protein